MRSRRVDVAVDDLQSPERMHSQSEQSGKDADFDHDNEDCRRRSFHDRWVRIGGAGIEFHHAGGIGDSFNAGKREHDADKAGPVLSKCSVQRLQVTERFADVRQTKQSKHDDHDCGRN